MEILELFLEVIFHPRLIDTLRVILGRKKYILAKDKEDNLICSMVTDDSFEYEYKQLMEEYLKHKGLEKTLVKFENKTIKKNDEQFKEILQHKLVMLDKELVLYKDVEEKAQEYVIKGYNGKLPINYGFNEYTIISKK